VPDIIIKDAPDTISAWLKNRATAHGVSEGEELLRILQNALGANVAPESGEPKSERVQASFLAMDSADNSPDWIFDRHDLRYRQPLLPPGEDFKAHLLALGKIGADIRLDWPREVSDHRPIDL